MKNKLISISIILIVCIVIYLIIYNYTTQINAINKNNTYESTNNSENNRLNFVNDYITTLKNNDFESGFNMLDTETKGKFNNDLNNYIQYIMNLTRDMNRLDNGLIIRETDSLYMKKYNIIEYELISNEFEYTINNEEYFSEEHTVFSEFKLIEYSPNVYEIQIR
jgi:NADH:ubiquinone oxidoreductase subunit 3 (subunit A)